MEEAGECADDVCPKCARIAVDFPPRNPSFHFRFIAAIYFCALLPLEYCAAMGYYGIVLFTIYGRGRISIGAYCKCLGDGKSILLSLLDCCVAFVTVLYATVSRKFIGLAIDELTKLVYASLDSPMTANSTTVL